MNRSLMNRMLQPVLRRQARDHLSEADRILADIDHAERNAAGRWDYARTMFALAHNNVPLEAPDELRISDRIAQEVGTPPEPGMLYAPFARDLTAAVAGTGGYLVGTENAPGDIFVGALLAASVLSALGVMRVPMQGNATVPGITTSFSAYWLGTEGAATTESTAALNQRAGTPKHVGVYWEESKPFLLQTTPEAQSFVLAEGGRVAAAEEENKVLAGDGASGRPLGVLNTNGIGSVAGASSTWATICNATFAVENSNGFTRPESAAWVLAPDAAKLWRQREKATGNGGFILQDGRIGEYRALVSNSVPAGTAIFGDWSGLAILDWGRLQMGADPFGVNSALFQRAALGLRALWSMDVLVLRPQSFCKITSVT